VTAPPPLPEHTLEENMEEAQVNESNLESEQSVGEGHLGDIDRNTMMDQYIALKAQEEELDGRIGDMEMKRANIADQIAELQADMNAIDDRKGDLEEEKARVRAEKRKLQIKLMYVYGTTLTNGTIRQTHFRSNMYETKNNKSG
jgi:chromosome segregation ATPase